MHIWFDLMAIPDRTLAAVKPTAGEQTGQWNAKTNHKFYRAALQNDV